MKAESLGRVVNQAKAESLGRVANQVKVESLGRVVKQKMQQFPEETRYLRNNTVCERRLHLFKRGLK